MSDQAPGPGWWLASDGRWYPPQNEPGGLRPAPPRQAVVPARKTDRLTRVMERFWAWCYERLWPAYRGAKLWVRAAVAAVVVVALLVVGGLIGSAGVKAADARTVKAEAATAAAKASDQSRIDALQSEVSADQAKIDQLQAGAAAVAAQKQTLDQQKAAQDKTAADQAATAAKLAQQQQAINASQFGDGLYQVGKDIQAGQYHTAGGSGCYWGKLRSSNTTDILDNNLSSGPQTVTVDSPYFISTRCGTWTKV